MGYSVRRPDYAASSELVFVPDSPTARVRYLSLAIIFVLWGAIYFAGIFSPALLDDVDTIHAEAAREMVQRHDWVTLYTDGIRYLEKAPLMYWSTAASYKLFGVSEWSTRLPLMVSVLALLLVTYVLGDRAYGERAGFYAAVVLGTSLGPYIFTRFQIPDIVVGLWMALSALFFLISIEQEKPSRWVCWGFAATCALNVLTKSLIGLVFPFGAIFVYLLVTRNLRHILKLRLVSRTIGFFTFSTRQEYYTLPAIPALALLVGAWLAKEAASPESESRSSRISSWVLFAIVVLGSVAGIALLLSSKPPAPGADLADLLRKNPQDYDLALGHFLDLTPEALGMFRPQLIAAVCSLLLGSGLNLWLRYQRKPEYGNMLLAGMMLAMLATVHAAFVTFSPILSSKQLAAAIAQHYQPGSVIVIDGQYHEASTLNFYLKTPVRVLHEPSGNLWYGAKFPDAPRVFET